MPDSVERDFVQAFFTKQLDEAWAHYRHCEIMPAEYLKMFFTGYLAATGFVVTLFKVDGKAEPVAGNVVFGVAILLMVVFCFSGIFYILVIRLNMVLTHYAKIMEQTRRHFFGTYGTFAAIWSYKDIGLHPQRASFFSISGSIPYLIVFLTSCLIPAELSLGLALISKPYFEIWWPFLIFVVAIAMGIALAWLYRKGEEAILKSLA